MLGSTRGEVTVWIKGNKDKHNYKVFKFDKDRVEIVLDSKEKIFKPGQTVLCTFELSGMNFFSEVVFQESISGFTVLMFKNTLFKSERRSSYRLMTYPLYEVWAEFDLGEVYEGGKVVDLKTGNSQTGLFKNFLQLIDDKSSEEVTNFKIRVQDLSTTGLSLHVGDLESKYFVKGFNFQNVKLIFKDEIIIVPEATAVYVVNFISPDKNLKKYKVGIHFPNLPTTIDDLIGKKINALLRENDFNKDFENFIK